MKLKTLMIFILCLFIGASSVVLAQMTNVRHLFVSQRVIDDYEVNIEAENKEIENLNLKMTEGKERLEALLSADEDRDVTEEIEAKLFSDLDFYELAGGFVDVEGPGIEIIIDDGVRDLELGENPNDLLVHDADLLEVINDLKDAGAEIISVNGQRILDTSSITCSGYTVRINERFYGKPFEIKAIGDASRMSAALIGPGGYGTLLKEYGLIFKISMVDSVKISGIKDERAFKHAKILTAEKKKEDEKN